MELTRLDDLSRFDQAKYQKLPLFESERFFCDVYCLLPGQAQKVHVHDGQEKVYIALEGSPTALIGDEERVLSSGEAVIARAGEPHGLENRSEEPARLLVFMAPRPS